MECLYYFFMYEITLLWGNIFVLFCGYALGKVRQFFFHQPQQMLIVQYFPIWDRVRVFSQLFLRLLFVGTGKEMKFQNKVDNRCHLTLKRLGRLNLTPPLWFFEKFIL